MKDEQINNETKEKNMKKELTLKDDIVFKAFFARKGNEEFLKDFLEALLKIEIREILIRSEVDLEKLAKDEKGGSIDLQAELNDGIIVDIEMQVRQRAYFENRTLHYGAKILSQETKRGEEYKDVKQLILINILDYELLGFDEYISESKIVLKEHKDYEIIKNMKWYFIELPKFRKAKVNMEVNMEDRVNQWLAFIDDFKGEKSKMAEKKNEIIKKAKKEMNYLTGEAAERRMQELRERWEMDYNSDMGEARKKGRVEGMLEGKLEGKLEGRLEGKLEGKIQGRLEGKEEIAIKLLQKKMSITQIQEITGIDRERIEELQRNQKK